MEQIAPIGKVQLAQAPAEKVRRLWGEQRAAEIAGIGIDGFRKWRRRLATGGTGGLIPQVYQSRFLQAAVAEGKALSAADLIAEPY